MASVLTRNVQPDELAMALVRERPLELFVDASKASMPVVSVSREWTRMWISMPPGATTSFELPRSSRQGG